LIKDDTINQKDLQKQKRRQEQQQQKDLSESTPLKFKNPGYAPKAHTF
jgi:hypothetical protein